MMLLSWGKNMIPSKNIIKSGIGFLLILLSTILIGYLLLILVYLLPTEKMKSNMYAVMPELEAEDLYPSLDYTLSTTLDNYTDSLMLGAAVYDNSNESVFVKALRIEHPGGDECAPIQNLNSYLNNWNNNVAVKEPEPYPGAAYTRYWHGYLLLLKPILCCTNYFIWRSMNRVIQAMETVSKSV